MSLRSPFFLLALLPAGISTGVLVACTSEDPPAATGLADAGGQETSTSADGGGAALADQLTELCDKSYGSFKRVLVECCTEDDRATEEYEVTAKAFNRVGDECAGALVTAGESGRITYDADGAQKCIDGFAPLNEPSYCAAGLGSANVQGVCVSAIHGVQPEGEACRADFECVDGLWCKGVGETDEGACAAPEAVGKACATTGFAAKNVTYPFGSHPHCASGAYCSSGATGKCKTLGADGDACAVAAECESGHCYLGECATQGPVGEGKACLSGTDCSRGLFCEPGAAGEEGTCKKRIPEGSDCSDDRCRGFCKSDGTCASFCGSG